MCQQKPVSPATILSEVLADLAFMLTGEDETNPLRSDKWLEATTSYDGPTSATLCFRCTRGFAVLLAANLLGIEPEDDNAAAKAEDAVKELMNIVCGQLVTALHGTQQVFNLSIPEVRELPERPSEFSTEDGGETSTLFVDGYRVHFCHLPRVSTVPSA